MPGIFVLLKIYWSSIIFLCKWICTNLCNERDQNKSVTILWKYLHIIQEIILCINTVKSFFVISMHINLSNTWYNYMNEIHFCQRKKILNMYDEEIRIFVQSVSITGLNNNPNLFSSWNLNFNIKNLYSIFFIRNGIYFSIAAVYRRWWLGGYLWTEVRFSSGPAPPTPSAEPCWSRSSLRARTPAHSGGSPSFHAYIEQNLIRTIHCLHLHVSYSNCNQEYFTHVMQI